MYFGDPWNNYWHRTRLSEILKILRTLTFEDFLDVGCAEGYILKLMKNIATTETCFTVGVDIAKNYLLKAKKAVPKTMWVLGDANHLPFRHNSFDLVTCSEVMEHLQNPEKAFEELTKISRRYILVTVAGENIFHYFARKAGLIKQTDPYAEVGYGHINEMQSSKIVLDWAPKNGFKCIENKTTCYFPVSLLKRNRMPTWLIPFLRVLDKCLSKIPVIKEFGATQVTLLENAHAT